MRILFASSKLLKFNQTFQNCLDKTEWLIMLRLVIIHKHVDSSDRAFPAKPENIAGNNLTKP